jgi:hypothetical protein
LILGPAARRFRAAVKPAADLARHLGEARAAAARLDAAGDAGLASPRGHEADIELM